MTKILNVRHEEGIRHGDAVVRRVRGTQNRDVQLNLVAVPPGLMCTPTELQELLARFGPPATASIDLGMVWGGVEKLLEALPAADQQRVFDSMDQYRARKATRDAAMSGGDWLRNDRRKQAESNRQLNADNAKAWGQTG